MKPLVPMTITYTEAGVQIATSTGTQDANPDNRIAIGYGAAFVCGEIEECFLLVRDKPLSSDEWTDLSAWLIEQIGAGW